MFLRVKKELLIGIYTDRYRCVYSETLQLVLSIEYRRVMKCFMAWRRIICNEVRIA